MTLYSCTGRFANGFKGVIESHVTELCVANCFGISLLETHLGMCSQSSYFVSEASAECPLKLGDIALVRLLIVIVTKHEWAC